MNKEDLQINIFDLLSPLHKISVDGRASAEFEINDHDLVISYRVWKSGQLYRFSNSYSFIAIAQERFGFKDKLFKDFEVSLRRLEHGK